MQNGQSKAKLFAFLKYTYQAFDIVESYGGCMETFKDIEGFEGLYQVSDLGRVKSLAKRSGHCLRKDRILKTQLTKDGYEFVKLMKDSKQYTFRVHRLVAQAFKVRGEGDTVNHIDGNKLNNTPANLEYCDRHAQMKHAYKLGLKTAKRGADNSQAKLTPDDVRYIRRVYKRQSTEFGTVALAKRFGCSDRVIGLILRGLSYKNVN